MSRIGNRIITVPNGVTVANEDGIVKVTGPKGTLQQKMLNKITMKQDADKLVLERSDESAKANHGTMNSLITNMITGVTEGYQKGLEIIGVGYNFKVQGSTLTIKAGYSHPVDMKVPEGLTVEAVSNTEIIVKGIDKAQSLAVLLKEIGMTKEEMIAVGDGFNDLSMIQYAGLGVAMANAQEIVRQNADYITLSNEEDGVAAVVEKFIL